MPENNNPVPSMEPPVSASIASAVHNIFNETFGPPEPMGSPDPTGSGDAPEKLTPAGTVLISDTPKVNPMEPEKGIPVEEEKKPEANDEDKPEEGDDEEKPEEGDDEEGDESKNTRASRAAGKAFAEMRVQLKTAKREAEDLRRQLEEAKTSTPDSEELEELRQIVKGYAYTATDEYKEQVSEPYNKANAKIADIVQKAGTTLDMDKLNEIALNPDLDSFDRDEAYENLATEAGLSGTDLARFVRMANVRDKAISAHGKFQSEAEKYVEQLKSSQGKSSDGHYEVNLDNYTLEAMQSRAREMGITSEITEDNLKHARHLAHKIDNGSFMDRALAEVMQKELLEARGTIEALEAKVKKLRGAAPRPSKGNVDPPETGGSKATADVSEVIRGAFDLLK